MVNRFLQLQTQMQFTYEQKDHHFGENPPEPSAREGIGKLLNKYARKAVDHEEDSLIQRKKLVYPANSLNYSQIYSDLRIEQKEKVRPEQQTHDSKFFSQLPQSLNYVPKSLPKIRRNSRISHNRESTKYVLNTTLNQSSGEGGFRAKAFSISHYDIYKNETKRLQLSQGKPRESPMPINDFLISKNSEVLSQSYHKDEKNIKVDFESMAERDLPDSNDQETPHNASTIVHKQMQIQPEHSLAELTKEQIKIDIPQAQPKGRKNSINQQEMKTHSKAESKAERKVEPEVQASTEKEESLSRKDSKLSRHSIRSKQKEIKLQQIKRQYSKKMEQQGKKEKPLPQLTKKESVEDTHDKPRVEKQSKQIQLFQRKIQKSVELPEIKRSISSIHQTTQHKEQMDDELLKFKEEISKVRKEIHGVKEEMIQVKQEVHGFKEEVHARKESIKKQNSRVLQKKQTKKEVYEPQATQSAQKQLKQEQSFNPRSEQKEPAQKVQIVIDGDSRASEGHKFIIDNYIEVYEILKQLQKDLKVPQINFHGLIKGVKKYLQVVALGGLDHVEQCGMPLNRLKIIKNALLYERISIVIIAFAFAVGKVKESLKYLINLVGYATNNTLLILKILEGGQSTAQVKNPVLTKSDRLVMKRNFDTIRNNNDIVLDSIFKISKQEEAFYEPFKEILKAIGKSSIEQTFYNVLQYFSFFLCVSQLSKNLPFLAVAPNPYLRQSIDKRPTLVIDIIEVFCHGTKKSKSHVFRPHTEHFLNEMSQYYQLISFTCAYPNQIDKVIDILDQKKLIKHRLYRHHALMKNNLLIKDPERIGRDPSRLIILDSEVALMSEEISNTIVVPSWKGNRNDTTLAELCPILAAIGLKKLDCRQSTRKIHEQQQKNEHAGIKYLNFGINLQ